jgi:hypothetical protein
LIVLQTIEAQGELKVEKENRTKNGFCEIKVKGKLEPHWAEWFDSMNIKIEPHTTIISGFVADQPALQGLIEKVSALGLTIVSFKFGDSNQEE